MPPPIRREARLEFDQRVRAVEKYQTPLDEDSKEEPTDPEPATIGKHYRAINYDLWTYWRMVHGGGAESASRGAAAPSRHRRASSPGDEAVAGEIFEFEAEIRPSRQTPSSGKKRGRVVDARTASTRRLAAVDAKSCGLTRESTRPGGRPLHFPQDEGDHLSTRLRPRPGGRVPLATLREDVHLEAAAHRAVLESFSGTAAGVREALADAARKRV